MKMKMRTGLERHIAVSKGGDYMGKAPRLILLSKNDIIMAKDRYKILVDFFHQIPDYLLENIGIRVETYKASAMEHKRYYKDIVHETHIDTLTVIIDGDYKNPMHSDKEMYEVLSIVGHRLLDKLSILVKSFDMLKKGRDFYEKDKV